MALTEEQINALIASTIPAHEAALTTTGRLVPAAGGGGAPDLQEIQQLYLLF